MRPFFSALAVVAAIAAPVVFAQEKQAWEIDAAHTQAGFAVKHMMVSTVRGTFGKTTGTLHFDGKDATTIEVDAAIETATINTGIDKRDEHLRSADFFDVASHPKITFKSKKAEAAGAGKFRLTGDLTMHGVTKEVTLEGEGPSAAVKDPYGKVRVGASATTKVSRKDFGLKWNALLEAGGVAVGDEVTITIDIEATKK